MNDITIKKNKKSQSTLRKERKKEKKYICIYVYILRFAKDYI